MTELNGKDPITKRFPHLAPDSDFLEMMAWGRAMERKVDDFSSRLDTWTNTILQTNLSRDQIIANLGTTLEQVEQNNASFGKTLGQLQQELQTLRQEFAVFKSTVGKQTAMLSSLSEAVGCTDQRLYAQSRLTLFSQLLTLNERLNRMEQQVQGLPLTLTAQVETLNVAISHLTKALKSSYKIASVAWGALALLTLLMLFQALQFRTTLSSVNANLNSALIRLQRLEQR